MCEKRKKKFKKSPEKELFFDFGGWSYLLAGKISTRGKCKKRIRRRSSEKKSNQCEEEKSVENLKT